MRRTSYCYDLATDLGPQEDIEDRYAAHYAQSRAFASSTYLVCFPPLQVLRQL